MSECVCECVSMYFEVNSMFFHKSSNVLLHHAGHSPSFWIPVNDCWVHNSYNRHTHTHTHIPNHKTHSHTRSCCHSTRNMLEFKEHVNYNRRIGPNTIVCVSCQNKSDCKSTATATDITCDGIHIFTKQASCSCAHSARGR